jgi:hypothetical protein
MCIRDRLFDSITISPTRTVVNIKYGEKNEYYVNGLIDLELVDETGHVYEQDAVSMGSDNVQLFFNDSIYFTSDVKSLTLRYTGYTMAQKEGRQFMLPVDIKEPLRVEYMGETFEVTSATWENGTLKIKANMPESDVLSFQEIQPLVEHSDSGMGHYTDGGIKRMFCSYDKIEKLDEYQVEIMYPKYKIEKQGEIVLVNLN